MLVQPHLAEMGPMDILTVANVAFGILLLFTIIFLASRS